MRKSKLDPHSEFIRELTGAGASNGAIRGALEEKGCDVSLERIRTWVLARGLRSRNERRGRPRKQVKGLLQILPTALPKNPDQIRVPSSFVHFLSPSAYHLINNQLAAAELQIPDCESSHNLTQKQLKAWAQTLGKNRVHSLSDMDFCLVAFWCTDLKPIPKEDDRDLEKWHQCLVFEACHIRDIMRKAVDLPLP